MRTTRTSKLIFPSVSCLACLLGFASTAAAYTPDDEVVVQMIDRGVKFLEKSSASLQPNQRSPYGPGVHVLKAYAHFKVMRNRSIPIVKRGVEQAIKIVDKTANSEQLSISDKEVYEVAVSILLLAEVDSNQYRSQLMKLRDFLFQVQYNNGAFGYRGYSTGDVSQVQYAMLALWTLQKVDISIDTSRVEECTRWLLRVQDPSGAWPYQGQDPGNNKRLISQTSGVGMSMALAGASAIVIGGDIMGTWGVIVDNDANKVYPGLPKAVKIPKAVSKKLTASGNTKSRILNAVRLCESYRGQTPFQRADWYYYQLYTLERYESFLETAFKKKIDESPDWYNKGVRELKETQSPEGAWGLTDKDKTKAENSTAFAILFLLRSTQRAIAAASTGTLAGGRNLPGDTTDIKMDGTKIIGRNAAANIGEMLDLLEDETGDLDDKSIPDDLQLAKDPKQRRAQLDRLERLARGSQSWQARRVAARLLGQSEQMRVVPTLIFALSDPDKSVRNYARDGLRFISRKFDGYGLADEPSEGEVKEVQQKWRQWYLRINPKHVFLN